MELVVLDGFIDYSNENEPKWMMRGIGGHAVKQTYSVDGLLNFARIIGNDPLNIKIDNVRTIRFDPDQAKQIKQDLLVIANNMQNN